MIPKTIASYLGYVAILLAAALAVEWLVGLMWDAREPFPGAGALMFLLAAAIAAWIVRNWKWVTPSGVAIVLLSIGVAWLGFSVYAVRGISLPTSTPYSWAQAAGFVITFGSVAKIISSAAVAGVLVAVARRDRKALAAR